MSKFIVYACPVGELAHQLDAYYDKSRRACGPNTAHRYMPHCTLTGFFEDATNTVPKYTQALERSLTQFQRSQSPIQVEDLVFRPNWHGLELSSDWLKKLILDFVDTAAASTRKSPLRPKSWLHLSLAYDFAPEQATTLQALAQDMINPESPASWELRFYQQHPDQAWICHQRLPLG